MTQRFNQVVNELYLDTLIGEARSIRVGDAPPKDTHQFIGVWDTGATRTVISKDVVSRLGLSLTNKTQMSTVNGMRTANLYLINIYLKNGMVFEGLEVADGELLDLDFLIGMDIIGAGDFAVTRSNGKTCVSYQVPHGDGPIDFVKILNPRR